MNEKQKETYSSQGTFKEGLIVPNLSWSKLAFLNSIALFLVFSGPLAFFSPIPLAMSFLLYGQGKTFAVGGGLTLLSVAAASLNAGYAGISINYGVALFYGFLIARTIMIDEKPVFGVVKNGFIVLSLMVCMLVAFQLASPRGIEQELLTFVQESSTKLYASLSKSVGVKTEMLRMLEDYSEKPSLLVDQIMNYGIGIMTVTVFLSFWVGTFVVLRNSLVWRPLRRYSHSILEMTKFQMPFVMVWPLIVALLMCVGHAYEVLGAWANIVGSNVLFSLGVFYFFQGIGILMDLITYWRIYGILRTLFVLIAVMTSFQMLALVGVLDTWIDFRRFFNKKDKDEGDNL